MFRTKTWIITIIILLVVYILGKSKHLMERCMSTLFLRYSNNDSLLSSSKPLWKGVKARGYQCTTRTCRRPSNNFYTKSTINFKAGMSTGIYYLNIQAGKTAAIRRTAVREAGVSRHHRATIECPPETPPTSEHYRIEGFKGGPLIGPHYAERR